MDQWCASTISPLFILTLGPLFYECNRENEASIAVFADLLMELDSMTEVHFP